MKCHVLPCDRLKSFARYSLWSCQLQLENWGGWHRSLPWRSRRLGSWVLSQLPHGGKGLKAQRQRPLNGYRYAYGCLGDSWHEIPGRIWRCMLRTGQLVCRFFECKAYFSCHHFGWYSTKWNFTGFPYVLTKIKAWWLLLLQKFDLVDAIFRSRLMVIWCQIPGI